MCVGVAISCLVDSPEKRMKFDLDGISGGDSQWYLSLTEVEDHIGTIKDVKSQQPMSKEPKKVAKSKLNLKPQKKIATLNSGGRTSKIISIEEISDEDDGSDDIMSYGKPDSDAEDSEDDPTLINRKKPAVPVYVSEVSRYRVWLTHVDIFVTFWPASETPRITIATKLPSTQPPRSFEEKLASEPKSRRASKILLLQLSVCKINTTSTSLKNSNSRV